MTAGPSPGCGFHSLTTQRFGCKTDIEDKKFTWEALGRNCQGGVNKQVTAVGSPGSVPLVLLGDPVSPHSRHTPHRCTHTTHTPHHSMHTPHMHMPHRCTHTMHPTRTVHVSQTHHMHPYVTRTCHEQPLGGLVCCRKNVFISRIFSLNKNYDDVTKMPSTAGRGCAMGKSSCASCTWLTSCHHWRHSHDEIWPMVSAVQASGRLREAGLGTLRDPSLPFAIQGSLILRGPRSGCFLSD